MNTKIILILLQVIFLTGISLSQSSVWKVSKKNKNLYLGGTIHLLREQDFPFPDEFDEAYNSADVLVFEADVKSLQDPTMSAKLMNAAVYGGDTTLQMMLSDSAYQALEKAFQNLGMQIALFNKMRVSMTIMTLTALTLQNQGMNAIGVDMYYLEKALEEEKKVKFLESVEKQINLLVHMGDGYEDDFIYYTLEDIHQVDTLINEMISSWRNGDPRLSEELLSEMKNEYPILYKDLLVDRNNEWMMAIKKLIKSKEVELILVGDMHLYGEDGLLNQLQKEGYETKQIVSIAN